MYAPLLRPRANRWYSWGTDLMCKNSSQEWSNCRSGAKIIMKLPSMKMCIQSWHLHYVLCIFSHDVVCFLEIFYLMLLCFVTEYS